MLILTCVPYQRNDNEFWNWRHDESYSSHNMRRDRRQITVNILIILNHRRSKIISILGVLSRIIEKRLTVASFGLDKFFLLCTLSSLSIPTLVSEFNSKSLKICMYYFSYGLWTAKVLVVVAPQFYNAGYLAAYHITYLMLYQPASGFVHGHRVSRYELSPWCFSRAILLCSTRERLAAGTYRPTCSLDTVLDTLGTFNSASYDTL
jgi:hypothetical protein